MLRSHLSHITVLQQLVASTSHLHYTASIDVLPHSTMGGHVRHIIEFFDCFLLGLQSGEIDYTKRKRDISLEEYPHKALAKCQNLQIQLEKLSATELNAAIVVWSEMQEQPTKLVSSIARELEYLFHHMVHHLALIGVYLRSQGMKLPENFGVAPSTISFWEQQKSACAP